MGFYSTVKGSWHPVDGGGRGGDDAVILVSISPRGVSRDPESCDTIKKFVPLVERPQPSASRLVREKKKKNEV